MARRQKPKPKQEEVRRLCPECGKPMPFAMEDEESVTLSCHGWNYRAFSDRVRLWRTLHIHGKAVPHEWDANAQESDARKEPVGRRG